MELILLVVLSDIEWVITCSKHEQNIGHSAQGRINDLLYMEYGHAIELLTSRVLRRFKQCSAEGEHRWQGIASIVSMKQTNALICDKAPADYTTIKLNQVSVLDSHMEHAWGSQA